MADARIENPILNSPFAEPSRHFRFGMSGITTEVVDERRISAYFMPIPQPKKHGGRAQLTLDSEWTEDRIQPNETINRIRERVRRWRGLGRPGLTRVTQRSLAHWTAPERERRLFFCQIEALETAIYLTEVADRQGDAWIAAQLRQANEATHPTLFRTAFKMATGSGKTVVMAMLVAWHALNKQANSQDRRFGDAFLIVTPGITIRDRLRVLLPNDVDNYYRLMDLAPAEDREKLLSSRILITNLHAFQPRERGEASRLTKDLLARGNASPFLEAPDQMVRRVCRELAGKKNLVVLNDEAHHCYRRKPDGDDVTLKGEERTEAESRNEEARIWISGLEAVKAKVGVKAVYDLSATPFFLRGSGYREGTIFPWVVSDFSLIDAIESGIVKVPRVPVADDAMQGELPTYRELWTRIREHLPRKGRKTEAASGRGGRAASRSEAEAPGRQDAVPEPVLPGELQGALHSLYGHYEKSYRAWEAAADAGSTPPVFIVVCNNTNVSKLVFDYVAGWERTLKDGTTHPRPGKLSVFSNVDGDRWRPRPNTILVDSRQLESGEGMSADFKKIAAAEIEEFKADYRTRFPGRDADAISDEDLLREVMNTVGKPGRLGENVRCVVSVSMLTEGWDANTVTHILGVRAFGTQLLCEQVVGRALRRMSYAADSNGMFEPEYAEVYGVPFSFIPCSGSTAQPVPTHKPTRVRALPERIACEITFPRLTGYRWEVPAERLDAKFTEKSRFPLSTMRLPNQTENAPIVGLSSIHTLDDLRNARMQTVAFELAKLVLERYFRTDAGDDRPWLFPQLLSIARLWLDECVDLKDGVFKQMLLLHEYRSDAADRIFGSILEAYDGEKRLKPILRPYDTVGSTRSAIAQSRRNGSASCSGRRASARCSPWVRVLGGFSSHLSRSVVCSARTPCGRQNSLAWSQRTAGMCRRKQRTYLPDFIVRLRDGLHLIVEVSGARRRDKDVKRCPPAAMAGCPP